MTNSAELLRELVELRARNARLEAAATKIRHWHDGVTQKGEKHMTVSFESVQGLWEVLCIERSPGFADKVLKLAAAIEKGAGEYRHEGFTPEEVQLLNEFTHNDA